MCLFIIWITNIKQNQNITQTIINCKDYSRKHNFSVQLFRAEGKNAFYARKRALTAHKLICEEAFCEICHLGTQVHAFQYTPSSLAQYNETIKSSTSFSMSRKKVQFVKSNSCDILKNEHKLNLNLMTLFRACETNSSFKELALLKTE